MSEQITLVSADDETKRRIKVLAALDNVAMPEELRRIVEQEWNRRSLQNNMAQPPAPAAKGKQ